MNKETKEFESRIKIRSKARRELANLYPTPIDNEQYGEALIASQEYSEIARNLERAEIPVIGVWQRREFTGCTMFSSASYPVGDIYVSVTDIPASKIPEILKEFKRISESKNSLEYQLPNSEARFNVTNSQPPPSKLRFYFEKLKQKIEDPFLVSGGPTPRIY